MNLQQLIELYTNQFESIKKDNGKTIITLKNDCNEELKSAVYQAHGDRLPDDYIFDWFDSIMSDLSGYDIETIDDVENYRHEIVDGLVDCYTSNLTEWLNSNNANVYYLSDSLSEFEPKDGFQALALAQYKAIDEVYQEVINLLEDNELLED